MTRTDPDTERESAGGYVMPDWLRAKVLATPGILDSFSRTDALSEQWDAYAAALDSFVCRTGHAKVAQGHVENGLKLGFWVAANRKLRRAGKLSAERIEMLESRAGWLWEPREQGFMEHLSVLDTFIGREGHARVPHGHVEDGVRLSAWVTANRTFRRAGKLSAERIEMLESRAGWLWEPYKQGFDNGLLALNTFIGREGHARVPHGHVEDGFLLADWLNSNRTLRRAGKLSAERVKALDSYPGLIWDPVGQRFRDQLSALDAFISREGHAVVPQGHCEDGRRLGAWVNGVRTDRRNGKLSAERIAELESRPGWVWNPREQGFVDGLSVLDAYIKRKGHAAVTFAHVEAGFNLGGWVSTVRTSYRRNQLSAERIAELEARTGWVWAVKA